MFVDSRAQGISWVHLRTAFCENQEVKGHRGTKELKATAWKMNAWINKTVCVRACVRVCKTGLTDRGPGCRCREETWSIESLSQLTVQMWTELCFVSRQSSNQRNTEKFLEPSEECVLGYISYRFTLKTSVAEEDEITSKLKMLILWWCWTTSPRETGNKDLSAVHGYGHQSDHSVCKRSF